MYDKHGVTEIVNADGTLKTEICLFRISGKAERCILYPVKVMRMHLKSTVIKTLFHV